MVDGQFWIVGEKKLSSNVSRTRVDHEDRLLIPRQEDGRRKYNEGPTGSVNGLALEIMQQWGTLSERGSTTANITARKLSQKV